MYRFADRRPYFYADESNLYFELLPLEFSHVLLIILYQYLQVIPSVCFGGENFQNTIIALIFFLHYLHIYSILHASLFH